jgi:hypothetical protein
MPGGSSHRTGRSRKWVSAPCRGQVTDIGDEIVNYVQGGSGATIGRIQNIAATRIEFAVGTYPQTNLTFKTLHACYYQQISFSHENQV